MRWRLERRGGNVFGLFSVAAEDLKGATFPVYVDTAIAEELVGASSDDAYGAASSSNWTITQTTAEFSNARYNRYNGFRWTSVPIPQGVNIESASFSPYFYSASNDSPSVTICGNDVDNAATFATSSDTYDDRAKTTANVNWVEADVGVGFNASPDIAGVVEEIVGRGSWASDNALALLTAGIKKSNCFIYHWDRKPTGTYAAKFNCTYTEGGGSAIPAIMHHYRQLRSR